MKYYFHNYFINIFLESIIKENLNKMIYLINKTDIKPIFYKLAFQKYV